MVAIKGADIKYNFKAICDRVFGGETVINPTNYRHG